MNPVDNCNVIRPLLSINRFETGKLCSFWQLPMYPDVSNQKISFLRNRVRKQLLPLVKIFFNVKVENVLLQLAEIVQAEDHHMNQVAKDFFISFPNISYYNFTNVSPTHYVPHAELPTFNGNSITSFVTNAEGSVNRFSNSHIKLPFIYWTTMHPVATFGVQKQHTLCFLRTLHSKKGGKKMMIPFLSKTGSKPHCIPQSLKRDTEAISPKVVIRWILTVFAVRARKNIECKVIPIALSNPLVQLSYSTPKEGKPSSNVCLSELCIFGNKGSGSMWYTYIKGGNYNKLQTLLLTKLMKQNFEFRRLALSSKMSNARSVQQSFNSNINNIKKSNKFIRKKYIEDVLIYNFFFYFEMLKPEKKEIYWPIVISFLPTVFQQRVTRLFLKNQDWKKIRYSHVFNFLAKNKKLC